MGTMTNNVSLACEEKLGNNLKVLEQNDQIKELQTIIRDRQATSLRVFPTRCDWRFDYSRNTSRSDFKFYADRLIRLVIEESLNQLPYSDCSVVTPTGAIYDGLKWVKMFRSVPTAVLNRFEWISADIVPATVACRSFGPARRWNKGSEIAAGPSALEKF